jgi:hypothetical protein
MVYEASGYGAKLRILGAYAQGSPGWDRPTFDDAIDDIKGLAQLGIMAWVVSTTGASARSVAVLVSKVERLCRKATSDSRRLQSYGKNCTFASNTTGRLLPIVFVSDVAQNSAVLCLDLAGEALRLQAVDMALQTMVRRLLLLECRAL